MTIIGQIILDQKLTCTEVQFTKYMNGLKINTSIYDKLMPTKCLFSKKYNGHIIENPSKGKYYYYITIGNNTFLQNTAPYVEGNIGLDDTNIGTVIADHKLKLIAGYVEGEKMRLTIANFTPKVV